MGEHIKDFVDLEAWKLAHKLALEVYKITQKFPKEEIYGITSQIRRSSSSVGANIAEGFGRYHFKDKMKFYYQARGSNVETQNFLLLSKDLGLITEDGYDKLNKMCADVNKLLNGLIRSISNQIS